MYFIKLLSGSSKINKYLEHSRYIVNREDWLHWESKACPLRKATLVKTKNFSNYYIVFDLFTSVLRGGA